MIQDFNKKLVEAQRELFQYAYQLTKDMDDANDLLQEASYKALRKAELYTKDSSFKGWVVTMMKNLYINEYRRDKRYPTCSLDELGRMANESGEDVSSLYDEGFIRGAIQNLSKEKREPISMFVEGYTYEEIAEATNSKMGTIKSRIHNARIELRRTLEYM